MKSLEKINPANARENEKANLTKEQMAVSELKNKLDVFFRPNVAQHCADVS